MKNKTIQEPTFWFSFWSDYFIFRSILRVYIFFSFGIDIHITSKKWTSIDWKHFFLKVVRQGYDVKPLDFGAFQHCTTALLKTCTYKANPSKAGFSHPFYTDYLITKMNYPWQCDFGCSHDELVLYLFIAHFYRYFLNSLRGCEAICVINKGLNGVNRQPSNGQKTNRQKRNIFIVNRQMSEPKLAANFLRYT